MKIIAVVLFVLLVIAVIGSAMYVMWSTGPVPEFTYYSGPHRRASVYICGIHREAVLLVCDLFGGTYQLPLPGNHLLIATTKRGYYAAQSKGVIEQLEASPYTLRVLHR